MQARLAQSAERKALNLVVVGSSPTVGVLFLMHVFLDMHDVIAETERIMPARKEATARGFEPLRAEPNGFLVHHLNHSVTLSMSFS